MTRKKDTNNVEAVDCTRDEFVERGETPEIRSLEYATVSLSFGMSKDEAEAIINKPHGQIARNMKKYVNSIINRVAESLINHKEEI